MNTDLSIFHTVKIPERQLTIFPKVSMIAKAN